MIRFATAPFQRTLTRSIQNAQKKLADTQLALNSGKRANDLAALGSTATRNLSARSLLSRQDAQTAEAKLLGTTLSLYDANITSIDTLGSDLREKLMTAIGTGEGASLQSTIEGAFSQFRAALNASDGNSPLFAGSQGDTDPFRPLTLGDTIGATVESAFANDGVRATARVGDGVDMQYGVLASEIGGGLLSVFRTLAEAGTIGDKPSAAQIDAFKNAVAQLDTAMPAVRTVNGSNGLRQAQLEVLETRGQARANLLEAYVSDNEDADYGQLATDLTAQKTMLQASFSVFSQLSGLSLVNYLR